VWRQSRARRSRLASQGPRLAAGHAAKPRPRGETARGEAASCRGKAARGEAAYNLVNNNKATTTVYTAKSLGFRACLSSQNTVSIIRFL